MWQFELVDAPNLAADAAWRSLYETAFPACEREPRSAILRSVETGKAIALRAVVDGETSGLGVAYILPAISFVFIAYLAVCERLKGHGLGPRLLHAMSEIGAERLAQIGQTCRGSVLEVEDPRQAPTPAKQAEALRRIAFFQRNDARLIDTPYFQPALDETTVVPLQLMLIDREPASALKANEHGDLVWALYSEKYGPINGIPPLTLISLMSRFAEHLPGVPS